MEKFYPRGVIKEEPGFPVETVPCRWYQFNPYHIIRALRRRVDEFKPDLVWVADGWALKPYLLKAFGDYKLWHRFFAYEMLCPLGNERFRRGTRCRYTVLTSSMSCSRHILSELLRYSIKRKLNGPLFEAAVSLAFSPGYVRAVREALLVCDRHIVSSTHYLDLFEGVDAPITVIPAGVDTDHFSIGQEEGQGILMVGRVGDPAKGFSVLKDALRILRKKGYDAVVKVTGNSREDEGIINIPWKNYSDMPTIYREASVVVIPSLWEEPFGKVAIEAMACGIPVVASRCGALTNIIQDGVSGLLFTPGNFGELAEKLELLLTHTNLRKQIIQAGRERAEDHFAWDKIVQDVYLPMIDMDLKI